LGRKVLGLLHDRLKLLEDVVARPFQAARRLLLPRRTSLLRVLPVELFLSPTANISDVPVIYRRADLGSVTGVIDMLSKLRGYVEVVLEMDLAHMAPIVVPGRLRHEHGSLGAVLLADSFEMRIEELHVCHSIFRLDH